MTLIPCSLTQTTNLPDKDQAMALILPSPECRILSVPTLAVRPILPRKPCAAAAALFVFALALTPFFPPTVRMRLPARPPDRYVLSLLYEGERATALTGRAKLRNIMSFWSTSEATQTWPSIEDVAMYTELDGVGRRSCCRGGRREVEDEVASSVSVAGGAGERVGSRRGETEIEVMDAECTRYVRSDRNVGMCKTWTFPLWVPMTILSPTTAQLLVESPLLYTELKLLVRRT